MKRGYGAFAVLLAVATFPVFTEAAQRIAIDEEAGISLECSSGSQLGVIKSRKKLEMPSSDQIGFTEPYTPGVRYSAIPKLAKELVNVEGVIGVRYHRTDPYVVYLEISLAYRCNDTVVVPGIRDAFRAIKKTG